jgi:fluoroquinolone transport system permease protein
MRLINAFRADVRFQLKQGFYLVYVMLTFIYMIILAKFPPEWKELAVPLVVFSDPSMVGFFFIGAIVMLEKVQGVLQYVIVTPLRSIEYLLAKVLSLTILAISAATMIVLVTYHEPLNWFILIAGITLTSSFFVLYGFIAAADCTTMNQYFIKMIPYMLLIVLPCFSLIGFPYSWIFNVFPSVAGLQLVFGAFNGLGIKGILALIIYLIVVNIALLFYVKNIFENMVTKGQ